MGSVSLSQGLSDHLNRLLQMYNIFESKSDMLRISTLDRKVLLLPQTFILVCPLLSDILKTHSVKEEVNIIVPDSSCSSVLNLYNLISHGCTERMKCQSDHDLQKDEMKTPNHIEEVIEVSKQFGFNWNHEDLLMNVEENLDSQISIWQEEKEFSEISNVQKLNESSRHVNTDDNSEFVDLQIKIEYDDIDRNNEQNSNSSISHKVSGDFSPLRVSGNSWCTDEIRDLRRGRMSTRCCYAARNVHSSKCVDTDDEFVPSRRSRRDYDDVSPKRFPYKHTQRSNFGCKNLYIGSPNTSSEVTSKGRKVQPPLRFYDWLFPYD